MAIEAAALKVVVSADTSKAESGLQSFSGKMKGLAGGLASVGGVLAAGISAPLIGIGVQAVKTAADFERSMNILGQVSGATADQMQAMSDQALQLGADTVFSANEAAAAMVELAKAGMETEDVMGAIPGVMDLAAAGAVSVEEAAALAAATINTFGLEASQTAEVADILAAAANSSSADIRDLAFGIQNAGSVFAASGQSVESLAAMMAILANNGITASDAATSLKTMHMRLTAPTEKAAKVMKSLGIAVFDAEGNMRDYEDIIADMEAATLGMSDAQREAAMQTVFGLDAMRAGNILAREGVDAYNEMIAAVSEQGAAAAMAEAQNSGLSGAMEQIAGSIDTLMTKLALPFLDELAAGLDQLTEFVNQIGELPQPVIKAALAFAGFAAALGLALLAAAGIATVLGALGTTITIGATVVPIGLIVLAVLGLAAAVAALWAAWETNWGNIQETLGPFTEAFTTARMAVEDFFRYLGVASQEGDVFNAWLLSVPPAWIPFAEATARTLIALQNLRKYLRLVVTSGEALNIWLFTLPPGMSKIAFSVGKAIVAVQEFGKAIQRAFDKTSFPTAAELWQDFKAGEWQAMTEKIQLAGRDLMINLEAELNLSASAEKLKQNIYQGLTNAINSVKWDVVGQDLVTQINKLKGQIEKVDFTIIDWALPVKALAAAAKVAIEGITWLFSGQDFENLKTAVSDAIGKIAWGDLGTAFAGLGKAILGQLVQVANDIIADMSAAFTAATGIELAPPVITIKAFEPVTMPAPPITVEPIPDQTIAAPHVTFIPTFTVPQPKPDMSGWDAAAALPEKMIADLRKTVEGHDWSGTGTAMGNAIVTGITGAIGGVGLFTRWAEETEQASNEAAQRNRAALDQWIKNLDQSMHPLEEAIESIDDRVMGILRELTLLGIAVVDGFHEMFSSMADAIMPDAETGVKAITQGLIVGIAPVESMWQSLMDDLNAQFAAIGDGIRSAMTTLTTTMEGIIGTIQTPFTNLGEAIGVAVGGLKGLVQRALDSIKGLVPPLGGGGGGTGGTEDSLNMGRSMQLFGEPEVPTVRVERRRPEGPAAAEPAMAALDWATYVKPLKWEQFVTPVKWEMIVTALQWKAHITRLDWDTMIARLEWETFVVPLIWSAFVSPLLWDSYVRDIQWSNFISDVQWGNFVPELSWSTFVPLLDWGRFIPRAPVNAAPAGAGGPAGQAAIAGTASSGGAGVTIVIENVEIKDGMDIELLAAQLAKRFQQKLRL